MVVTGDKAMKKYYMSLVEIDKDETKTVEDLASYYIEFHNIKADIGGGFQNMTELMAIK